MRTIHCSIPKGMYAYVKGKGRNYANELLIHAINNEMKMNERARESTWEDAAIIKFCNITMSILTRATMRRRWLSLKQIYDIAIREYADSDVMIEMNEYKDDMFIVRNGVWLAVEKGYINTRKNKRNDVFQYKW